jgi:hypothetical protein
MSPRVCGAGSLSQCFPHCRVLTSLADVENMRVRMANKAEEDRKFAVTFLLSSLPLAAPLNPPLMPHSYLFSLFSFLIIPRRHE